MSPKSKIVCPCLNVTEAELLKAIHNHKIQSLKDIIEYTSAGDGCTACQPLLKEYLDRETKKDPTSPRNPSAPPDNSPARSP